MVEAVPRRAHRADRDVGVRMGCAAVAFGGCRSGWTSARSCRRSPARTRAGSSSSPSARGPSSTRRASGCSWQSTPTGSTTSTCRCRRSSGGAGRADDVA